MGGLCTFSEAPLSSYWQSAALSEAAMLTKPILVSVTSSRQTYHQHFFPCHCLHQRDCLILSSKRQCKAFSFWLQRRRFKHWGVPNMLRCVCVHVSKREIIHLKVYSQQSSQTVPLFTHLLPLTPAVRYSISIPFEIQQGSRCYLPFCIFPKLRQRYRGSFIFALSEVQTRITNVSLCLPAFRQLNKRQKFL